MTHGEQKATSDYKVVLNGEGSSADVVSRSVAKDDSEQIFEVSIEGNTACNGHAACDAIIMGNAHVVAIPKLDAKNVDAALEDSIGVAIKTEPDKAKVIKELFNNDFVFDIVELTSLHILFNVGCGLGLSLCHFFYTSFNVFLSSNDFFTIDNTFDNEL